MTQDDDTLPNEEQWLSAMIINHLKSDKAFVYPESVVEAISTIVIAVHNSYKCNDNAIKYLSKTVVQTLQKRPVANQYMQITRKALAQKSLIFQLLILMQDIVSRQRLDHSSRLIWLVIALHTAALLITSDRRTDTYINNILMQFKMAQFSTTPRRVLLWQELPDIAQTEMNIERILSVFNTLLQKRQSAFVALKNNPATDTEEVAKAKSDAKAKLSQIEKITTAYQHAHVPQKPRPKRKKPPKNIKIEAINLADNTSTSP